MTRQQRGRASILIMGGLALSACSATKPFDVNDASIHTYSAPVAPKCAPDAVPVGPICVDKYEASVWTVPQGAKTKGGKSLVSAIKAGTVKLSDLQAAAATHYECLAENVEGFPGNGNGTANVYAVSVPGVKPSGCVTWFQAEIACRVSGKRMLTNVEWQAAAMGTPDPGSKANDDGVTTCNLGKAAGTLETGKRAQCVSRWGTYDMVGNLWEWVADWVPRPTVEDDNTCNATWPFGNDVMCIFGGKSTWSDGPTAPMRGGFSGDMVGTKTGVFAIHAWPPLTTSEGGLGFRCGR